MKELEQILGLFAVAAMLAAIARRVGAPYPVFLALGGALLAFVPGTHTFNVPPDVALALSSHRYCSMRLTMPRSET